ncbi:hypothetical protein BV582_04960 [Bacillus paralicheniformis]|nr:hypothetical protein BV582_04960 [Bacillus paralicheniformis]
MSDIIQIVSIFSTSIISIISIFIAVKSLKLTQKSIEDANRPYIVVYRDYIQVLANIHEYIVIKNFGKSGATIESLTFEPNYLDASRNKPIFKNIKNTFIAPGQSIVTPTGLHAFENNRKGVIVATINYRDNIRTYSEKMTLNEEILNDIAFTKSKPSKNESIQTVIAKAAQEFLRKNL